MANWYYKCPYCGSVRHVPWANRKNLVNCGNCKKDYTPPTPAEQPFAYVDDHDWPDEMETVVRNTKGSICTVPGCNKSADTLDHRVPYSKFKKGTSVHNLYPMCKSCNSSKDDEDYFEWLRKK